MTEEKESVKKEVQKEKEIDPLLNELIDVMKTIKEKMPDYEKEERITVFLEYRREKENHFGTEKQNMSNEKSVDIESLLNSLTFRTAKKNGDLKYAVIDLELAKKLPKKFEVNGREYSVKTYENEKKAVIYEDLKKVQKQKNVQKQ
jgi:hypothetical protein